MKVLIVDDDTNVSRGLKLIIPWKELNSQVIGEARNGEEAFKIALIEHPDLIITDIKMPIMDGLELCKKVNEVMSDTVIILLSAYEDFDYARTALQYGVKNYFLKPISRDKIEELISEISVIYDNFEKKRSLYTALHDENIEQSFFAALKAGNAEFFNNYFRDVSPFFYNQNINLEVMGVKYIDIVFRFFKDLGVNSNIILDSKETTLNDFLSLKTRQDMERFIKQLFMDVLLFRADKKDTRVKFLADYTKTYIQENYASLNLSVSDIANKLNVTSSHLGIIFRKMTGMNIITFIKDLRIEKACELLKDTMLTIVEIAEKVGFQDAHYFSNVFKKSIHLTPSEYRSLNYRTKRDV